ncbi:MAG: hypothetical protein K2M30_04895, partial [Desulfovibrionaceae bacterium]|nr:hypothetical protein [Desulfovibrionaceae bacterium]
YIIESVYITLYIATYHEYNGRRMNTSLSSYPKVSVALPVYNTQERHLRECIESILAQSFLTRKRKGRYVYLYLFHYIPFLRYRVI